MPLSPLGSTHGRTTSGVACHHRIWAAQMVEQRRAWHPIITFGLAHTIGRHRDWHAIISLGRQTRLNDFRRGMPSSRLGSTHSRTTSGVAWHHRPWPARIVGNAGRCMTSPPLDNTHGLQCRVWYGITALRQNTWSNNVGCCMTSPPLDYTHDQ